MMMMILATYPSDELHGERLFPDTTLIYQSLPTPKNFEQGLYR